jgi:glyoxylase-like metal-dependent hydrolase (beta-lactamase superfamily II)
VNAYLVRGADRCLLIDTGMNRPECREALDAALRGLDVNLARTDVFVTHGHADHVGLASALQAAGSRIWLHPLDVEIVLKPSLWSEMQDEARQHGFPDPGAAVRRHPGRRYLFEGRPAFTPVREGDELRVGRYAFRCVETPGHTPGHTCLYEPAQKIVFSGDHVLDTITPNISAWSCGADPLGQFLDSLEKIAARDTRLMLPAHRNAIRDPRRRIEELRAHHRARLQEVLDILADGPRTAYEVASRMTWSLDCPTWAEFPIPQQWFATGEALSHLLYLERRAQVGRQWKDGTAQFSA